MCFEREKIDDLREKRSTVWNHGGEMVVSNEIQKNQKSILTYDATIPYWNPIYVEVEWT